MYQTKYQTLEKTFRPQLRAADFMFGFQTAHLCQVPVHSSQFGVRYLDGGDLHLLPRFPAHPVSSKASTGYFCF
jgi:hypothetical protein